MNDENLDISPQGYRELQITLIELLEIPHDVFHHNYSDDDLLQALNNDNDHSKEMKKRILDICDLYINISAINDSEKFPKKWLHQGKNGKTYREVLREENGLQQLESILEEILGCYIRRKNP